MRSIDRFHSPAPEELMAFVDGEGSADARAAIEMHLDTCAACRALVEDQRRLTGTLQTWRVPDAPASLQPPQPEALAAPQQHGRARWLRPRTVAAGLAAAAVVLVAGALQQRPRLSLSAPGKPSISLGGRETRAVAEPPPVQTDSRGAREIAREPAGVAGNLQGQAAFDRVTAAPQPVQPSPLAPRGPSVIRTARLHIVTKDFATARESVESIVSANGGFVDDLSVTGDTAQARVLRGTLRVRSDRFRDALARLRALGIVMEDTQGTQDVTDQIVDLDARLAGARATEQRLTELLRNRTGRLSDVLEVEREVTRVRVEIERLDAEKTNVTRRVSYATINIAISEERKESLDGPVPLTTKLKVAALDGIESALDSIAAVALFVLRAGPSLLFWGGIAALAWMAFRRAIRDSPTPTASE